MGSEELLYMLPPVVTTRLWHAQLDRPADGTVYFNGQHEDHLYHNSQSTA